MRSITRIGVVVAGTAFAMGAALPAFADSGPNSPTATHNNPSSCLGAERATRNSNGGDRAQGGFGPAQSTFVGAINDGSAGQPESNYGQFLQDWKATC